MRYHFNKYSQSGEDGVIEKIFEIIPPKNRICIELGAWDGFHLSNTANLWTNGWKGILIKADKDKFTELVKIQEKYDCICINEFVSFPPENTLEAILKRYGVDYNEVDFLSIDIDGDDWYVFESLDKLKPKVICCEYNDYISPHISYVQKRGAPHMPLGTQKRGVPYSHWGCSARALTELADKKGYTLISIIGNNCFYIKNEYIGEFKNYWTGEKLLNDLNFMRIKIGRKIYNFGYFYMKYGIVGIFLKIINTLSAKK